MAAPADGAAAPPGQRRRAIMDLASHGSESARQYGPDLERGFFRTARSSFTPMARRFAKAKVVAMCFSMRPKSKRMRTLPTSLDITVGLEASRVLNAHFTAIPDSAHAGPDIALATNRAQRCGSRTDFAQNRRFRRRASHRTDAPRFVASGRNWSGFGSRISSSSRC